MSRLLQPNDVVGGRYRICGPMLGEGSFSEVFPAEDRETKQQLAIKIEKNTEDRVVLAGELKALEGLQGCSSVCKLYSNGTHRCRDKKEHQYIAMEVGMRMLQALKEVHEAGFVHRDVKPANFTIGFGAEARRILVIDFGLTRKFKDENGKMLEQRANAQFRGSSKYASIYTHRCEDQGRRDDMWSLFYVMVECLDVLPWTEEAQRGDKDSVLRMKLDCMENPASLTSNVTFPPELRDMCIYLKKLQFADQPDYSRINNLLMAGLAANVEMDWEAPPPASVASAQADGKQWLPASAPVLDVPHSGSLKRDFPGDALPGPAKRLREQPSQSQLAEELSRMKGPPPELSRVAHGVLEGMRKLQPRELVSLVGLTASAILQSFGNSSPDVAQRLVADVAEVMSVLKDRLHEMRPRWTSKDSIAAYR